MITITRSLVLALFTISFSVTCALAQSSDNQSTGSAYYSPPYQHCILGQSPPTLQGATMGTIGPQGTDATMVEGIMTAGTVRVNNLANLEAALNILAMFALFMGHVIGIWYLVRTIRLTVKTPGSVLGGVAKGLTFISVGLLSPSFVNWAVAMARDVAICN